MMKLTTVCVMAPLVAAFLVGGAACKKEELKAMGQAGADQGEGKGGAAASTVRVARPERRTIHQYLEYTGTVEPVRQVRMVPEISAKIEKLYVDDGDHVKEGQLLARFDTKLYKLQKNQASAALKLAKTQVSSAKKEYDRIQPLADSGAVSKQQVDQLESGLDTAKAGVDQAQAALALASYSVKQSRLKAPFAGIVTSVLVNEGEYVGPQLATYGMLTLVDISTVKIKVNVTERDLPLVRVGQSVEVVSDAYPDQVFQAKVATISPSADPVSKSFPVAVELPNPEELLKAGMFVRVQVHVKSRKDALVVPPESIIDLKDRMVVYLLGEGDRALVREVTVGIEGAEGVEIEEGDIGTEDRIIIEGNFGLKDGAHVLVAE